MLHTVKFVVLYRISWRNSGEQGKDYRHKTTIASNKNVIKLSKNYWLTNSINSHARKCHAFTIKNESVSSMLLSEGKIFLDSLKVYKQFYEGCDSYKIFSKTCFTCSLKWERNLETKFIFSKLSSMPKYVQVYCWC